VLEALFLFQQLVLTDLPRVDKNPFTTDADIEQGSKLYAGRCAGCHGPQGDGGKGANLAVPVLSRASTDLGLYRVIRYGIPETEMPSHNMTEREIWQIAGYVRSLGSKGAESSSGNPQHGASLVSGRGGCLQCHMVNGEGGHLGPPLTDIGQRRSAAFIRSKLLKPEQDESATFRFVRLTTRNGQKISGVLLNEDNFSIQVRDNAARLYSFWKKDVAELDVQRRTLMPSYATQLSADELNDVVAYLAGIRGAQ
jgi:putative heme-binding domain-containing protein